MRCDEAQGLISAHLDRELDLVRSLDIEDHLRTCGACASLLREQEALRAAMGASSLVHPPPAGLEARVLASLRREARGASPARTWRWAGLAASFALGAALTGGVTAHRDRVARQDRLAEELVSGHVRSLLGEHLLDVASSDRHTVKPWFNGRVDFAPTVLDFAASGFPLAGGRVDYLAGRPVAALVYHRRQHVVNVFVWALTPEEPMPARSLARQGYNLRPWTGSGLTYCAVSDVGGSELEELVRLFRETG